MSLRANGLTGQAENHALLSVAFFVGFFVAMHIMLGVILTLPRIMHYDAMLMNPALYFRNHGLWTSLVIVGLFGVLHMLQPVLVQMQIRSHDLDHRHAGRVGRAVAHHCGVLGIPMPQMVQIPSDARNAVTYGLTGSRATIGVTTGMLESLDDDALAAVLAHECVHIKRGDVSLMSIAYTSLDTIHLLRRLNPMALAKKMKWIFIFMWPLLFVFVLCGFAQHIAMTVANVTRLLIASSRDFVADAETVRLTHNPQALIRALRSVEGRDTVSGLSPMLGASLFSGSQDGQEAHHAPVSERVDAIARLSGAMMQGGTPVRDTRAAALAAQGGSAYGYAPEPRAAFGRVRATPVVTPAVAQQPKRLIDRVNTDGDTNVFGFKGKAGSPVPTAILLALLFFASKPHIQNLYEDYTTAQAPVAPPPTGVIVRAGGPTSRTTIAALNPAPIGVPVPRLKPKSTVVIPRTPPETRLATLRR